MDLLSVYLKTMDMRLKGEEYEKKKEILNKISDIKNLWKVCDFIETYGLAIEKIGARSVAKETGVNLGDVMLSFVLLKYDSKVVFRTVFICPKCGNQLFDCGLPGDESYPKKCNKCFTPTDGSKDNINFFITISDEYSEYLKEKLETEFIKETKIFINQLDKIKENLDKFNIIKKKFDYYKLSYPKEVASMFDEKSNDAKFVTMCDLLGVSCEKAIK